MVVLGVGVLVISALMFLRDRRRPKAPASQTLMDALILQIAELDAQHEAGEIADDLYKTRRAALKTRLAEVIDQK
jgi:hypothetical protein